MWKMVSRNGVYWPGDKVLIWESERAVLKKVRIDEAFVMGCLGVVPMQGGFSVERGRFLYRIARANGCILCCNGAYFVRGNRYWAIDMMWDARGINIMINGIKRNAQMYRSSPDILLNGRDLVLAQGVDFETPLLGDGVECNQREIEKRLVMGLGREAIICGR